VDNFLDLLKVYKGLKEDGSLTKEDAIILLSLIIEAIEDIKPHIANMWIRIGLSGAEKLMEESREHIKSQIDE
jgi:hypothetical protein